MYKIKFVKELNKWAVINENDDILVYSDTKEGAIDIMEYMNKNGS